jgi:hypothetical protein
MNGMDFVKKASVYSKVPTGNFEIIQAKLSCIEAKILRAACRNMHNNVKASILHQGSIMGPIPFSRDGNSPVNIQGWCVSIKRVN